MLNSKVLLLAIIILAALFRLPFLGQIPNGFTGDEAQQGYSAYSILKTGHDEWGESLPLFPRGFGDYKPPLQTYLLIPSIALFGLTIEAVRYPAAQSGILAVLVIYFLAIELTGNKKVGFWAAFLLAISPWAIQVSRTAFEGGFGITGFSLGLLFFLKGLRQKNYLFLSALFWGLTLYSYHSFRVFLALFIVGLLILFREKIINKKIILPTILLLIFTAPLIFNFNQILTRSSDVGITSPQVIEGYFKNRTGSPLGPLDKIFDNKYWYITNIFISNYLSYYSTYFFFTGSRPDNSYLNFPGFPLLYQFEIIFWFVSFWLMILGKVKGRKVMILWFLLSAIPASLATGNMNAGRVPTFLPLTAIISGIGAVYLMEKLRKRWLLILVPISVSLLFFTHFYFIELPQKPANNLRFGYDQVFKKAIALENQNDEIVFSKAFTEPQIFIAFYGKVDPIKYQDASNDWLRYEKAEKHYIDQLESWNLGKYKFEDINWAIKDSKRSNALIISKPEDFPEDVSSILDIKNPYGKILFRLVKIQ